MADMTAEQLSAPVASENQVAASQLSAMVDDELELPDLDLALRRLSRDHELQARWERYYLIGNAMQSHLPDAFDLDFAARIRQAVDAEPLPRSAAKPLPAWYKPVTGFGLAASVALVALFGLKLTQTDISLLEAPITAAPAVPATAVQLALDTGPIAEIPDVLAAIDDPGSVIWDARSEAEYMGQRSGSRRAGHIPGAVNLDWVALMDPQRHLRLREDCAGLLAAHGITADKRVITHCQTHHRSGLTYLAARLLNFPEIQAYHGSWSEWGNRDDTPVEMSA